MLLFGKEKIERKKDEETTFLADQDKMRESKINLSLFQGKEHFSSSELCSLLPSLSCSFLLLGSFVGLPFPRYPSIGLWKYLVHRATRERERRQDQGPNQSSIIASWLQFITKCNASPPLFLPFHFPPAVLLSPLLQIVVSI